MRGRALDSSKANRIERELVIVSLPRCAANPVAIRGKV
jgi:hypothetical protein